MYVILTPKEFLIGPNKNKNNKPFTACDFKGSFLTSTRNNIFMRALCTSNHKMAAHMPDDVTF